MQLGGQWIVEFGVRENEAREQSWKEKACQGDAITDTVATPSFGGPCLGGVGHLLLVAVSGWVGRRARFTGQTEAARHCAIGAPRRGRDVWAVDVRHPSIER